MDADLNTDAPRQRSRRRSAPWLRVMAIGMAALIAGRTDRPGGPRSMLATALLMYIPLLPLGLAALPLDLCWTGRSCSRFDSA